jgi:hypothetical protein
MCCLNFQQHNSLENQYLPHLSSGNCEMNSMKSDLPRAFQEHQEHPQNSDAVFSFDLFSFHWENGSIINNFHTVAANSLKPSLCTRPYWEFSEDTMSAAWSVGVWEISARQNKTNYLALEIGIMCASSVSLNQWLLCSRICIQIVLFAL